MLLDSGFTDVAGIEGGINAWRGLVAAGPPEAGMAYFSPAERPERLIALAWALEEGSRRFYAEAAEFVADEDAVQLFRNLAAAEELHKSSLIGLYREIAGEAGVPASQESPLPGAAEGEIMEGGMRVAEALEWIKGKGAADVLDLSIALESNSYDLYLKMERGAEDDRSKRVFRALSDEEKRHLAWMTSLIEKKV